LFGEANRNPRFLFGGNRKMKSRKRKRKPSWSKKRFLEWNPGCCARIRWVGESDQIKR
jgi:hypothetical protein